MMTVLSASVFFYSCETTELEDLASPNALSADLADVDLLLNSIQLNYLGSMGNMHGTSAPLARIQYMFGRNYYENYRNQLLLWQYRRLSAFKYSSRMHKLYNITYNYR